MIKLSNLSIINKPKLPEPKIKSPNSYLNT